MRPADELVARVVLDALRGGDPTEFDVLDDRHGPDLPMSLVAGEHGAAWARTDPGPATGDPRLQVIRIGARMHRYDGTLTPLDGVAFEALGRLLEDGRIDWATHAATIWRQLVLHAGEGGAVWPQAEQLLVRQRRAIEQDPLLLAAFGAIASVVRSPAAAEIWDRVMSHPDLGADVTRRCLVELDWSRCHLLPHGSQTSRAVTVLARVERGLRDASDGDARLAWIDAVLQLACGLAWLGRLDEAHEVIVGARARVQPGGEFLAWIDGVLAYVAAVRGDAGAAADALRSLERATTDTSSLLMHAIVPARIHHACSERDLDALRAAIADAERMESGRPLDAMARASWRVHALEAAVRCNEPALAARLATGLAAVIERSDEDLSIHRLRLQHAQACLDGAHTDQDLALEAASLGLVLPDLGDGTGDQATHAPSAAPGLEIDLFGAFEVRMDGTPIDENSWSGRRQAKLLLALLLVDGGRIDYDRVVDLLWSDLAPGRVSQRISPLCNAIRTVLDLAGDGRSLTARGGTITLELAPADRCDLLSLRALARRVDIDPTYVRDRLPSLIRAVAARPLGGLGTDDALTRIRTIIEEELATLLPRCVRAWEGMPAPDDVVHAIRVLHRDNPLDVDACASLMRLLHDRGDAPGASSVYHVTRSALADELGLRPPAALAHLHARTIGNPRDAAAELAATR